MSLERWSAFCASLNGEQRAALSEIVGELSRVVLFYAPRPQTADEPALEKAPEPASWPPALEVDTTYKLPPPPPAPPLRLRRRDLDGEGWKPIEHKPGDDPR